jgi:hypothetical protein
MLMNVPVRSTSLLCVVLLACSDSSRTAETPWRTTIDTIGDTIIVRTAGGASDAALHTLVEELRIGKVDGEAEYTFGDVSAIVPSSDGGIYVADAQSHVIRQFDAAGVHLRSFGGNGAGPGEFDAVNGMARLPDGRIVLWDPTNARVNVYSPTGQSVSTWGFPTGMSRAYGRWMVFSDSAGNTYLKADLRSDGLPDPTVNRPKREALYRFDRDGVLRDSLRAPVWEDEPPQIRTTSVRGGRIVGATTYTVPWKPTMAWTWSPLGYFVAGRTDRYVIEQFRPDGKVVRIERDVAPVAIDPEERTSAEELLTSRVRRTDPTWQWTGVPLAQVKPYFDELRVGLDGRLWVSVSQPSEKVAVENPPPPSPDQPPPPKFRWRSRARYDVFEPDGRYLGRVEPPRLTSIQTMRGNQVWAVVYDSLDVPFVTRFRIQPPF